MIASGASYDTTEESGGHTTFGLRLLGVGGGSGNIRHQEEFSELYVRS